jgi:hypothetical protein
VPRLVRKRLLFEKQELELELAVFKYPRKFEVEEFQPSVTFAFEVSV